MARDAVESLGSIAEIVFLLLISSIYVSTRYLETKKEYSFRSSKRNGKKERKKEKGAEPTIFKLPLPSARTLKR